MNDIVLKGNDVRQADQQRQARQSLKLLGVAACVRAVYLVLIAAFALAYDDYDTSTSILSESCADDWPDRAASAQQYLPGVVWDSIFLHRIAACGYEYEQFFAFYPGVPGRLGTADSNACSL